MNVLQQIYNFLPGPARSFAAGLRGYYLRSWRYGPETESLVEEALERETWHPDRWKTWQMERLAFILNRAAIHVPYYRNQWSERRRNGDRASWEYLENWPVLEKESVRKNPKAFVAEDCDVRYMFHEHTSGTTGKSLDLWWSRKTVREWYALFEARCRRWYAVSRHDRWAILGGQLVAPAGQQKPPFWAWNRALNQLYMSSYHLAPDFISYYLDALLRYRVKYLWGYTSSLYTLSWEILRAKRDDLKMTVVITNAEPVFDYQREVIANAFQCPVRETYGMAEIVAAASECPGGALHLWPDVGWMEVFSDDEDAPVLPGKSGRFICTGLLNADMPLIHYCVGDSGILPVDCRPCSCKRSLPILGSVEGRTDDMLYTADGRRIGRLDPVFKSSLPVREAQIIQEALERVVIRYVPAPEFTRETGIAIIEGIKERMGKVEIVLEEVDKIPRSSNGKFRAVICNLSPEEKSSLERGNVRKLEVLN